jgi:PAS domain S-box-containing protein
MSLRWKILLVTTFSAIAIIGTIYFISQIIFMKSFETVEKNDTQQETERTAKELNNLVQNLNTVAHDWATSNDTYSYVSDPAGNANYVRDNIRDSTFTGTDLNFIFLLDNTGDVLFSRGFNLNSDQDMPIPEVLSKDISSATLSRQLPSTEGVSGLLLIPEGVLMISSQPVIGVNSQGQIAGTVIMARYLDPSEVFKLYSTVLQPLSVIALNGYNYPKDVESVIPLLTPFDSTFVTPLNAKSIAGYKMVQDILGNQAVIVKITLPRDTYVQSVNALHYFLFALLGFVILFAILLTVLLNRVVILRVRRIADYVADIRSSGDLSKRLMPAGHDEISSLKKGINEMVGTLEQSQNSLEMQKKSAEKLRITIESVSEGIITSDLGGWITDVNDAALRLHGFAKKEEMIGRNIIDMVVDEDRPKAEQAQQQTLINGNSGNLEYTILKADGAKFFGEASSAVLKDPDGKPIGFVTGVKDVTERNQAEAAVLIEKEMIDRILAIVPNAVLVIDKNDKILLANRSFEEYFGQKMQNAQGKVISEIITEKELQDAIEESHLNSTQKIQIEFKHVADSAEKIFICNILSMEKEETLIMFTDMTQERERQERLYLTDRLASVGEMAAGIAHELNNPLTSVIAMSQLLLDEELPKDLKEDLESIFNEARRAANVVKNMLTFARKHKPNNQKAQINQIVEDVLKLRAYEHKVSNITIERRFDANLPEIQADYFQIQQVFLNITLNAEHEMIKVHKQGILTIVTEQIEGYVKISFTDDGAGISPVNMRKLFTPFFTTKEIGKGTGLGLSICYGIIKNHGGKIYAKSEIGEGATFIIELPINN